MINVRNLLTPREELCLREVWSKMPNLSLEGNSSPKSPMTRTSSFKQDEPMIFASSPRPASPEIGREHTI